MTGRLPEIPIHALGIAGIAGPVVFAILVIVQGVLQPGYSQISLPVSALSASPLGWLQELTCSMLGVSLMAFALGLHKAVRPGRTASQGGAGAALIAMGGVGVLVMGAFAWKLVDGTPTETPPHVVAAITAFASTAIGFMRVSSRLRSDAAWKDLASYTRATGLAMLVLFVGLGFFAATPGTPLHPWAGLIQRGLFLIWFACVVVLSRRLMTFGG